MPSSSWHEHQEHCYFFSTSQTCLCGPGFASKRDFLNCLWQSGGSGSRRELTLAGFSATSISGRSLSWWRSGPWLGVCPTIRSFGKKVRQHLRLFQCFHVLLGKSIHHDSKETSLGHWEAAASLHLAFPATFLDAARARTAAVRNLRNDSGSGPSLSRDISSRVWNTCMSCRNICLLSDMSCGATWLRRQWGSFPSPGRTTVSRDGVLCAWARAEWRERHMNEWTPRRFQGRKGWVPVVCPLGGSCRGKLHPCNV